MTQQEILNQFYQELVNENKWETENYKLVLIKGGLRIMSKLSDKQIDVKYPTNCPVCDKPFINGTCIDCDKLVKSL